MIITIDAHKAAHQLAVIDTSKYFHKYTSGRISEQAVIDAIENGTSLAHYFAPTATIDNDIQNRYQGQHDYYFEILTNHIL
jgi:hypothetical protein